MDTQAKVNVDFIRQEANELIQNVKFLVYDNQLSTLRLYKAIENSKKIYDALNLLTRSKK